MKNTAKPNVLFFFTDDQRFDAIGALGHSEVKTPNIDRLVARGTTFTHAHIPSGTSGAVCMPSRAMLHTGRTLYHLEDAGQKIPGHHTMLGEMLRQNGYRTFGTGKWHQSPGCFNRSFESGDEIFFGGMEDHWNVPANHYDPSGEYPGRISKCLNPFYSSEEAVRICDHVTAGKHSSELFCDAAIRFLEAGGEEPFFAYVSFMAPHDPRVMPRRFRDLYDPADIELPPNFMEQHPFFAPQHFQNRDERLAACPRERDEVRRHIAEYYAIISHLDHELGRVLDALERVGEADDTIIVFAGDNGLALGQHGLMGKQSCYEHSNRVPLIFSGPGVPKGRRTDAYAYLLDVFPTLCELIGSEKPDSVEGASLVGAMHNEAEKIRDHIFYGYTGEQRAIKDRRYKLIEYACPGHRATRLYDLAIDPWETHDLSAHPDQQGRLAELRAALRAFCREWDEVDSPWGREFWKEAGFSA